MEAVINEIRKLQSSFNELLMLFCRDLDETETANHKVAQKLRTLIFNTLSPSQNTSQNIRRQLENKMTCGEILESLVSSGLIGYWNYELLKKMKILSNNQDMLKQHIEKYEEHYSCLIKETDFLTLMMIFDKQPCLKPVHCVGLPIFLVKLKINGKVKIWFWDKLVKKRFSWSDEVQLIKITLNCIVLHFSVLPIAARAIVRDLTNKQILMELEGKGITDIILSEELLLIGRIGINSGLSICSTYPIILID